MRGGSISYDAVPTILASSGKFILSGPFEDPNMNSTLGCRAGLAGIPFLRGNRTYPLFKDVCYGPKSLVSGVPVDKF